MQRLELLILQEAIKRKKVHQKKPKRKILDFSRKRQGQRCFICKKKNTKQRHYTKNCPNKSDKVIKMINALGLNEKDNVESLYSKQINDDDETIFALLDSSSETSESRSNSDFFPCFQYKKYKISTKHVLNLVWKSIYYPLNMLTQSKPLLT